MESIHSAYRCIDENTLSVVRSMCILTDIPNPKKPNYVRLEEQSFVLTEETKRCSGVATAHDLSEYKNRNAKVRLESSLKVYMDYSIEIRKELLRKIEEIE